MLVHSFRSQALYVHLSWNGIMHFSHSKGWALDYRSSATESETRPGGQEQHPTDSGGRQRRTLEGRAAHKDGQEKPGAV